MEVEALNADPSPIASLTVPETVAHLARLFTEPTSRTIIMGHSFGGTLTQLLLDHGCGAAGVAIDSAPTEGVHVSPPSQIKSLFPILKNPANRHKAVGFTPEEFHYAFANTLSEEESRKVYDRYHIAAAGNWVWAYGLIANIKPGHQETWVNYRNDARAPALSSPAAKTTSCLLCKQVQRQALQVEHDHRGARVLRPFTLDVRRARQRSPTTPSTGPSSTPELESRRRPQRPLGRSRR